MSWIEAMSIFGGCMVLRRLVRSTRAKVNMKYHRIYSHPADKSTGVMADQTIALDGFYTRLDYPQHLRRVRYVDPETSKRLVFLTNNFALPAETIAALYEKRWQVELFFDDLPYCTPSYVIEKTGSVDWDYTFAEFLRDGTLPRTWQHRPSEAPKEHWHRLGLPADALAESCAAPSYL